MNDKPLVAPRPGQQVVRATLLTRQCLDRHLADQATVSTECDAWNNHRNAAQLGIDWHFTTENARTKLKHLYPKINA